MHFPCHNSIVAADEHALCILKARFHLALGELGAHAALHLWLLMASLVPEPSVGEK